MSFLFHVAARRYTQESAETLAITAMTAERTSRVWRRLREDLDSLSGGLKHRLTQWSTVIVTKEVTASLTFSRQRRMF